MKPYGLNELRKMYLDFFESKGHLVMPSFSLVPQNDKSLLLINAGMAPLKPYFTGQEIPRGLDDVHPVDDGGGTRNGGDGAVAGAASVGVVFGKCAVILDVLCHSDMRVYAFVSSFHCEAEVTPVEVYQTLFVSSKYLCPILSGMKFGAPAPCALAFPSVE